jgi:hypothetical protein
VSVCVACSSSTSINEEPAKQQQQQSALHPVSALHFTLHGMGHGLIQHTHGITRWGALSAWR